MTISRTFLEQHAVELAFDAGTLEKVIHLGTLAGEVARHGLLGSALLLKGGTAQNLCLQETPRRLSVDLDYNYVAHAERERMQAARPAIEKALEDLLRRLGYRVQHSADAHAGRKVYAFYRSALGNQGRVEIDLNFLWRVPLAGITEGNMWQPGEMDRPRIRLVSSAELCVGKFLAYLDRSAPRDAYDLALLNEWAGETLRSRLFRAMFIAFSATLPHPLNTYQKSHVAARLTPEKVREQLLPMLKGGRGVEADEILQHSWEVMEPFMELTPGEREYVEQIAQGEIRAEHLFPDDPETARRVSEHPAIRWKVTNVRREKDRRT